jgi:hypothetical protein
MYGLLSPRAPGCLATDQAAMSKARGKPVAEAGTTLVAARCDTGQAGVKTHDGCSVGHTRGKTFIPLCSLGSAERVWATPLGVARPAQLPRRAPQIGAGDLKGQRAPVSRVQRRWRGTHGRAARSDGPCDAQGSQGPEGSPEEPRDCDEWLMLCPGAPANARRRQNDD